MPSVLSQSDVLPAVAMTMPRRGILFWSTVVLLIADAVWWLHWTTMNLASVDNTTLQLIGEEPSLKWLMTFGELSIALPIALLVIAFQRRRLFPHAFFLSRIGQMLILWMIGTHLEKIASGLQRYRYVFGPSTMKMAAVLMNDATSSFFLLFVWFIVAAPIVALSLRSPKIYTR